MGVPIFLRSIMLSTNSSASLKPWIWTSYKNPGFPGVSRYWAVKLYKKFIYDFLCVPFRCWGSEVFRVHLGHYKPAKRPTPCLIVSFFILKNLCPLWYCWGTWIFINELLDYFQKSCAYLLTFSTYFSILNKSLSKMGFAGSYRGCSR